jgi:hypothetical protein
MTFEPMSFDLLTITLSNQVSNLRAQVSVMIFNSNTNK